MFVRPAIGVHVVVLEKPERVPVKAVRSALRDHDNLPPVGVSVLGGGIAADNAEFADGIHVGTVVNVVVNGVVDVDAIEGVVVGLLAVPVHEKAAVVGGTSDVIRIGRGSSDGARC